MSQQTDQLPRTELGVLADQVAGEADAYVSTITEIAAGKVDDSEIALMLLAVSRVVAVGGRLGAMVDIVPPEQFEPDYSQPDEDFGPLLVALSNQLEGLDDYADLVDPLTTGELTKGHLSGDLISIAEELFKGLRHFRAGQPEEALWWWQFSYLSNWGERAAAATRILVGMLSHLRLDTDEDTMADAEFNALHQPSPDPVQAESGSTQLGR